MMHLVTAVRDAEHRIRPYVRTTYLEHSRYLSERGDAAVHLKLENFQHTGSFKVRGALNRLLAMTPGEREGGVVAASTGNHGAAVAWSAKLLGMPCAVFVPRHSDSSKVDTIRRHGATIEVHGYDCTEAEDAARQHAAAVKSAYVSPYNDPLVIAGQGTVGFELAEQLDQIDTVFVSMGGGGLAAGVASYLKGIGRVRRVVACSPANSAVMMASLEAGRILDMASQPTLSDGTAGGVEPGAITFELCRALLDDCVTVTESEIARTMRGFLDTHHLLIEGAAAVAVAGYEHVSASCRGETVAIVICGGNVGADTLRRVL